MSSTTRSDRLQRFAECFDACATPERLRRELGEQAEDAVRLEAALDRAVRAVRDMRRSDGTADQKACPLSVANLAAAEVRETLGS